MSKFSKVIMLAAAVSVAAACSDKARIDVDINQAASSEVIVKKLNVNKFEVLDTVAVDASGKMSYAMEIEAGQPEFVYLFHGDKKIASLLLSEGEKVHVSADTLGNYTVTGSEESARLAEVEKDLAAVSARLDALTSQLEGASAEAAAKINAAATQEYVAYYRSRVRYVMENSKSLTVVPVFYQVLGEGLPVFSQITDAIHMSNICDSLETVYPESRYVKLLRKEADSRKAQLELNARIGSAEEIGFPDITLPDVTGQKVTLSNVDAKVVIVHFWTSTEAAQKMFNVELLKSIYNDYHKKGLEIYQVALDPDKGTWANVVKEQQLPWTNVCDGRGANSPYALLYNIGALPATYIIADGELVDGKIDDEKSLRKFIEKLLK
jgi:peroxiredoxin